MAIEARALLEAAALAAIRAAELPGEGEGEAPAPDPASVAVRRAWGWFKYLESK